ncbi:Gfo/Idh/MocA family protein [Rubripirellula reticaptiva]|uniref:1,5-anhydro-D-fructose reductase n=1 Tax=Rubripirellula reticaptiva TaxID=2528013 RepID=A0A5C6FE25_9BACT|nr:Gfo/Idh/MocA family oxidoreductase [Rubripirellula reticaptiva]TWU57879.1 1,5-anhydro-D-fructose reductase [Rubripirellula reticaptiva]
MSSSKNYRWGVLGTGYAAREFTSGLQSLENATVTAVGSESSERASNFAKSHSIETSFGTYDEVIHSDSVDIVYVGTVAPLHRKLCLQAIEAGKPVLCEKPFAMSAAEASEIAALAKAKSVFCMEAMWSRFIPLMVDIRSRIRSGEIGEIVSVAADFGLRQTPLSNPRLFHPEQGGALRDLGVYPISLAVEYLGMPDDVRITCAFGQGGADVRAGGSLHYQTGAIATVMADISAATPTVATIIGTEGFIEIQSPMYRPTRAKITHTSIPGPATQSSKSRSGVSARVHHVASAVKRQLLKSGKSLAAGYRGNGYQYQAREVMECLDRGLTESSTMPLSQSIEILKVIDLGLLSKNKTPTDE